MKKLFLLFLLITSCTFALNFNNETYILNGTGVRKKAIIKLYTANLYLKEKNSNAQNILESKEPMLIELTINSSLITSDDMKEAINDGFKNSATNFSKLQKRIDEFNEVFVKENIIKNDIFKFESKDKNIIVYKNEMFLTKIEGQDFKEALFGIWLGENPIDKNLKLNLLKSK